MNSPTSLLHGESLVWVTYDRGRGVSAALRWMLQTALTPLDVRLEVTEVESAVEAATQVEQRQAGLLTLIPRSSECEAEWPALCKTLRRVQLRQGPCLRCVYASLPGLTDDLRLWEAGAQIVINQIPWLQRIVPRIVTCAPRRTGGNHPLTIGLVDRLPWA